MGGGLHRSGNEFREGDAGEDEQSAGGAAPAKAFSENKERGNPGKDRFQRQDEGSVGRREELLRPGLHGKGDRGGQHGGNQQSREELGRPVNPGMFQQRGADGHKQGAEANLQDGELLEGKARGEVGQGEDVEGEADGAGEGEQVAEIHAAEGEAGAGRGGEEDDADEGDQRTAPGIPARGMSGARAQAGYGREQGHQNDYEAGDKGGFGWSGKTETGGLELIADREAESDGGAGSKGAAIDTAQVPPVDDQQADEGEGHAEEIEEKRRDAGKGVFDNDEGRSPDTDDRQEDEVRAERARA